MMKIINILKNVIVIVTIIYGVTSFANQQKILNTYASNSKSLDEQIGKAEQYQAELNDVKNNVNSHEYIEQIAREKLDMYLPNERVYVDNSN